LSLVHEVEYRSFPDKKAALFRRAVDSAVPRF
jgi:hypothetical protein